MLYDSKWDRKPTLAGFVAFLGTKPREEVYSYWDYHNCAIAQYLQSLGLGYVGFCVSRQCESLDMIALWNQNITAEVPHTFGAALERALAYAEIAS